MKIKVVTEYNSDEIMQQAINDMHPTKNMVKEVIKIKEK